MSFKFLISEKNVSMYAGAPKIVQELFGFVLVKAQQ